MQQEDTRAKVAVLVSVASGVVMGQHVFEANLQRALAQESTARWITRSCSVRSLRSRSPGTPRLPLNLVGSLPVALQELIGRAIYGRTDLVHRLDLRVPPSRSLEILTVHDLSPLMFEDEGRLPHSWKQSIRQAAAVVTVSDFIASEIQELCGVLKPRVIPNGYDPELLETPSLGTADLRALGIRGRFVLHAGGATQRKNLHGLSDAWRIVSARDQDVQLVLCGPAHPRRTELFGALDRCLLLGHVPRHTMVGLLRTASVVVVPSVYEGFGLPVLEAMVAGVPVVASKRSSLPEVCGGDGILVEPDGDGLAAGITRALENPPTDQMLDRAKGRALTFTWERAARAYTELYDEVSGA